MTRLYVKLALSGLRRRRLQATLTVAVVTAASAAATLALGIARVADDPWERTFAATNAPHVTVTTLAGGPDLTPVERLPGVVASTGVTRLAPTTVRLAGRRHGLLLFAVGATPPLVARPLIDAGSWVRPGGVVLERSFARFHGIRVGDRLLVGAEVPLRVDGIAVVARDEPYPRSQPGHGFASRPTVARIVPDRSVWGSFVGVRLRDPDATGPFMARAGRAVGADAHVSDWRSDRVSVVETTETVRIILAVYSLLLLLAGGAILATLVGGRLLAQVRELALLKAAGLTPAQVARVVLLEQLLLGLAGAALGIVAGTAIAPVFVAESASLLQASETPAITAKSVAAVLVLVVAGVTVFALVPAARAGRRTTAELLAGERPRFRRSRLARLLSRGRLPLAVEIGARESLVRPGRVALTALSLAVTAAAAVGTLAMEASFDVAAVPPQPPPLGQGVATPAWDPVDDDAGEAAVLRPVVYGLDAVLLFVGLSHLAATIMLGVRERVRDLGLLKAVGLTPRQATAMFLTSQTLVAAIAGIAGIPLGLALFRLAVAADGSDEWAYPAWWSLALLVPAMVGVVLAVAAPLARRAASVRVVDALRYE